MVYTVEGVGWASCTVSVSLFAAFELGDRECGRGWQNAVARLLTFDPNHYQISWVREK